MGELWPGAKTFNVKTSWLDNFRNAIERPIIESFENESCLNSFYNKIYFAPSLTQFVCRGTTVYFSCYINNKKLLKPFRSHFVTELLITHFRFISSIFQVLIIFSVCYDWIISGLLVCHDLGLTVNKKVHLSCLRLVYKCSLQGKHSSHMSMSNYRFITPSIPTRRQY